MHGEAGSVNPEAVEEERARLHDLMENKEGRVSRDNVYNVDKTAFYYAAPPTREIGRGFRPGVKKNKGRLSLAVCCNASGTDLRPLLFIGKAWKPRAFSGHICEWHKFAYHANAKAWMTGNVFCRWLFDFNRDMVTQGRNVVLFMDNFSGHKCPELSNIDVYFFAPNMTAFVQPLDAGIMWALKAIYRSKLCRRAMKAVVQGRPLGEVWVIN